MSMITYDPRLTKGSLRKKIWRDTHPEAYKEAKARDNIRLKEKRKNDPWAHFVAVAHSSTKRAIKMGYLVKPALCEHCGKCPPDQFSHWSYAYAWRMMGEWLCRFCHQRKDKPLPGTDGTEGCQRCKLARQLIALDPEARKWEA
jgi:hypothetical protein